MNSVNQIFLLGAAGKDPEIRATGGGTTVASVSIATSESRKDAQGNWSSETTWHNVKAFGRVAETIRDHVKKGAKVFVEGRLTVEEWADKASGAKRSKAVVVACYVSVVPSVRDVSTESRAASEQRPPTPRETLQQSMEITDADIPF